MDKKDFDDELSMDKIEDYNGNESNEKKRIVRNVIIIGLLVGAIVTYYKLTSVPDDYIGTAEKPGIDVSKK
jgi:hypothetical protein